MPEHAKTIKEIAEKERGIAVAKEALADISTNPDERARLLSHRKWLQDREHDKAYMKRIERESKESREKLETQNTELEKIKAENADMVAELAALRAQLEQAKNGSSKNST